MSNQKGKPEFDLIDGKNYKTKFDITKKYGMEKAIKFYNKLEKFDFIVHLSPVDLFKRLEEEDHKEFMNGEEIEAVYYVFGSVQSCYAGIDKEIYNEEEDAIELDPEKVFNCLYLDYSGPSIMSSTDASKLIEDISSQQNIVLFKDASYKIAIPRHPVPTDPNIYLDNICKKLNDVGFGIKLEETFVGNKERFKYLFLSTSDNLNIGAFDSIKIFFESNDNIIELDALSIFNNNKEILIVEPENSKKEEYQVKHSNLINIKSSEEEILDECGFEVGDKVFSYQLQKYGKVMVKDKNGYVVNFSETGNDKFSNLSYRLDGKHSNQGGRDIFFDEVKIVPPPRPLPKLEKDTKVLVWKDGAENSKVKRYFSHFSDSKKCVVFTRGCTSWSQTEIEIWDNWELAIK